MKMRENGKMRKWGISAINSIVRFMLPIMVS